MATTYGWPHVTKLRKAYKNHGHAMPFGQLCLCNLGTSQITSGPVFIDAQGQSVPISGGSPPIS